MRLSDFSGIFKKSIATVDRIDNPFDDYYVVHLKPDPSITWTAGEHAVFRFRKVSIKGRKFRPFSVASAPEEGVILLGTRTGTTPSAYKNHLLHLKKGSPVIIHGPFGWFKIRDDDTPIVLFAAGVGITPIRALLVSLAQDTNRPIEIIYSSESQFLFEKEIEAIVASNSSMTLHKVRSVSQTHEQLAQTAQKYGNRCYYYISGAPGIIKSVRALYKENGIKRRRMINDPFYGYK